MTTDQAGMLEPRAEQHGKLLAVCRARVWVQDLLALAERKDIIDRDRPCQTYRLGGIGVLCIPLTEEPSGHLGRGDRDSLVSRFASAAFAVGHLQWLLCTFPAWIASGGGSLRVAEEAFSPEASSASARVSAC